MAKEEEGRRRQPQTDDYPLPVLLKALNYLADLLVDLRVSQEFANTILEAIIHLVGW